VLITTVVLNKTVTSCAVPRKIVPRATKTNPPIKVAKALNRDIANAPRIAASASIKAGNPDKIPTCVPDMYRSRWISGITGAIARMVIRKTTPASHNRIGALKRDLFDIEPFTV
jgi:hypothetical protein